MWTQVLILGDSLSQFAFSPDGCWAALLANRLQRIADVLCRGLAGYTTRWYRAVLPEVLAGVDPASVSCVLLFLGVNDCAHENCPSGQHVPLHEYRDNLKYIVTYLQDWGVRKDRVILLNPPTYYHDDFESSRGDGGDAVKPCRSASNALIYAAECLQVGKEMAVTCVDIHSAFQSDPRGRALLSDGMHFSTAGSQLVFDEVWPWIEKKILEHVGTQSLEQNLPYWMEFRDKFNQRSLQPDQNIP